MNIVAKLQELLPKVAIILASITAVAAPTEASAQSCPSPYSSASCGGVCAQTGGALVCNVVAGVSVAYVVSDYGTSSTTIEAFGNHNGTDFCCPSFTGVTSVDLNGSAGSDTLQFEYASGIYNLLGVEANIDGGDGNDAISGSNATTAYHETLNGDNGADTINGWPGDDDINGGDGADTIVGHNGADAIDGGNGDDVITGGAGDDVILGGSGDDRVGGGPDDDTIDGGVGADTMCGDAGADNPVDDGDTTGEGNPSDKIWNEDSGDADVCNHSSTRTDNDADVTHTPHVCTTDLTTRPAQCP